MTLKSIFSHPHREWLAIAGPTLLAILLRVVVGWTMPANLQTDPDAYAALAIGLETSGTFGLPREGGDVLPTAFRPPLYPWILSFIVTDGQVEPWRVLLLHACFGGLTVFFAAKIGLRLLGRFGWLAGFLVAIDPILLQQSSLIMTETLATLLATATIWMWIRFVDSKQSVRIAMGLSIVLALAYLCRPTFLPWGVLLVAAALLLPRTFAVSGHRQPRWLGGLGIASCLCLAMLAWMYRNDRELGKPIWATTHGGYTLLLANNPPLYDHIYENPWSVWDPTSFFLAWSHRYDGDVSTAEFWSRDWGADGVLPPEANELRDDVLASRAAQATIGRQPGTFVWSSIVRLLQLWSPIPHALPERSARIVQLIGTYYVILFIACFFGLARLRRKVLHSLWWASLTLLLTLSAIHAIYWSNMRMRAPATVVVAVFATAAITRRDCCNDSEECSQSSRT